MNPNEHFHRVDVIERARAALERAIAEPSVARHRCDLSNCLNYLETISREVAATTKAAA